MRHEGSSGGSDIQDLYNIYIYITYYILHYIYIIYISVKSLSNFRIDFFKKIYEVIYIINFKNTLFKGFTRGGPWVPSLVKQNLNRTKNIK